MPDATVTDHTRELREAPACATTAATATPVQESATALHTILHAQAAETAAQAPAEAVAATTTAAVQHQDRQGHPEHHQDHTAGLRPAITAEVRQAADPVHQAAAPEVHTAADRHHPTEHRQEAHIAEVRTEADHTADRRVAAVHTAEAAAQEDAIRKSSTQHTRDHEKGDSIIFGSTGIHDTGHGPEHR